MTRCHYCNADLSHGQPFTYALITDETLPEGNPARYLKTVARCIPCTPKPRRRLRVGTHAVKGEYGHL